jgi:hypothetical protein
MTRAISGCWYRGTEIGHGARRRRRNAPGRAILALLNGTLRVPDQARGIGIRATCDLDGGHQIASTFSR